MSLIQMTCLLTGCWCTRTRRMCSSWYSCSSRSNMLACGFGGGAAAASAWTLKTRRSLIAYGIASAKCKMQPSRVSCDHVTKIRHTNRTRVRKLFHTWTAKCHHTDTLPGLRPRILTELTLSVPVCFSISIKLHVSVSLCSVASCLLHLITPSISLFAHSCSQISLKTACYNLLSLCESWNHRCRQFSINVDAMSLPQIQAGLCYFEFGNTTSLGRVLHF